jgi:enediyne biosynthesis protein E3
VHVGAGWVLARVPGSVEKYLARFDPVLGWLVVDGYGFHEGYFHWRRQLSGAEAPRRLRGYARRVFDQGLGRSLWFVDGTDVERLTGTIGSFPAGRRPDLWSGAGLAAVYAGEVSEASLELLRTAAGACRPQLAQGAAFAAKARQRAGNATDYTGMATRKLCGVSVTEAARLCDETLENLPATGPEPAYETWRRRIQHRFTKTFQPQEI